MSEGNNEKQTLQQMIDDIHQKFEEDQQKVSNRIKNNVNNLSEIKQLANIKMDLLTLRQELIETSHALNDELNKYRITLNKKQAKELENISTNKQVKYTPYEKKYFINSRLANINKLINIYENQVNFYDKTIQTIDKTLYDTNSILDWYKQLGI